MEKENPSSNRYMGRNDSDTSGAFSDCNSDRSGEFPSSGWPTTSSSSFGGGGLHRLLVSYAVDYSHEVVRRLISDLESPSATVESQRRAAMELRLLAKHNPENRLRIAAAGAVGPLVALVSHPDPQLQEHGVTAVLNLSLCDENKTLIAAAGAIRPLVRALSTGTPVARENAACALLRLAQLDDLRTAIGRSGAIPPLVALLESGGPAGRRTPPPPSSPSSWWRRARRGRRILPSDPSSRSARRAPSTARWPPTSSSSFGGGGLHRLLVSYAVDYSHEVVRRLISDLESPSATVESQRRAAMELRLLAKHNPENRLRIAAAGAVGPLVALVSHPDPQLQEHGVTAVLNLSLCDENKTLIAAAGAIRPLVRALSTGTPVARENAACALLALLRLAQLDDLRTAIGRSGAIPPLVALLESGGPCGKKDAATALFALLASRENKARAVEAGIVRSLLDLMADPDSGMVDKAAYVLNVVVEVAEGRAAAVEEDGIPVLVEMVEAGTSRQKDIAVRSLLQICKESAIYRKMAAHEGAIPPLVALSQSASKKSKEKVEALIELLRQPRRTAGDSRR
ncbi:hypothetical protein C4D60_Mb03t19780 [Musa balbisiana]|uniref:U-box domain-containing protein n=1 Tax=Musa balbisiana TaxID=52838 RepID=A0A4S8JB67_MUSBA|nr:hypothetical protein C4D60_Mb03t19780 [Musa balbisiana]